MEYADEDDSDRDSGVCDKCQKLTADNQSSTTNQSEQTSLCMCDSFNQSEVRIEETSKNGSTSDASDAKSSQSDSKKKPSNSKVNQSKSSSSKGSQSDSRKQTVKSCDNQADLSLPKGTCLNYKDFSKVGKYTYKGMLPGQEYSIRPIARARIFHTSYHQGKNIPYLLSPGQE